MVISLPVQDCNQCLLHSRKGTSECDSGWNITYVTKVCPGFVVGRTDMERGNYAV